MNKNELRKVSGIYKIFCTANNKVYIGQTKNLGRRFGEHRSALARGVHRNPELQADYNIYGCEAFEYIVIEKGCSDLDQKERKLIKEARSLGLCYNIFDGDHKGASPNQAWKDKVSKGNSGKVVSAEQRKKISIATSNQWKNQEYRNLMVSSAKVQWCDDNYRKKMYEAHFGKGNIGASKLTADIVREARNLHLHGKSIKELADMFGVSAGTMRNAVNRRTWTHI